jgi:hypothetical protein
VTAGIKKITNAFLSFHNFSIALDFNIQLLRKKNILKLKIKFLSLGNKQTLPPIPDLLSENYELITYVLLALIRYDEVRDMICT